MDDIRFEIASDCKNKILAYEKLFKVIEKFISEKSGLYFVYDKETYYIEWNLLKPMLYKILVEIRKQKERFYRI